MMKGIRSQLRALLRPGPAWYALAAAVALTWVGILAIHTVEPGFARAQAQRWLPISLIAMAACMIPRPRTLGLAALPLMAAMLGVLGFIILPFAPRWLVPVINGSASWINLGFMNWQPSEMAKVILVLTLAWYLRYRASYRTLRGLLAPFVITLVPMALILKQPDLGTALLLAPTLLVMLIAAGAKLRHMGTLLGLAVLAVGVNVAIVLWAPPSMQVLQSHQQARIRAMVAMARGSNRYAQTSGYQQDKAITLVSAGGISGYGAQRASVIIKFNKLPEDYNDMIFAVVVNRWGLLGALGVIALYLLLFGSFLLIAARSKDPFARLSCVGFAGLLFTQAMLNIAINLGLTPVTGITLPLISYGGSSLVSTYMMLGLVLNFASRRPQMLARPSFEFDSPANLSGRAPARG